MIECAIRRKAELVIVTRDSDYGVLFDNEAYINDHLIQEFSERVSRQRKILLYSKLSEALRHFKVAVTAEEEKEEEHLIQTRPQEAEQNKPLVFLRELFKRSEEAERQPGADGHGPAAS